MSLARLGGNRAMGHLRISGPEGTYEADTFTCSHCSRQVVCKMGEDVGKTCMACFSMICPACVKLETCEPFEKKLLEMESRDRLLKHVG